jgi:hypothetical protein
VIGALIGLDWLVPHPFGRYAIPLIVGVYLASMALGLREVWVRRRAIAALRAGSLPARTQDALVDLAPRCRKCGTVLLMERVECPTCGILTHPRRAVLIAVLIALSVLALFVMVAAGPAPYPGAERRHHRRHRRDH